MAVEPPSTFTQNLDQCTNSIVKGIRETYQHNQVDEEAVDSQVDCHLKKVKDSLRQAKVERIIRLQICSDMPIDDLRVLNTATHNNQNVANQSLPLFNSESGSVGDASVNLPNVYFTQPPIFDMSEITQPIAMALMDRSSNNSITEHEETALDCDEGLFSDDLSYDLMNNDANTVVSSRILSTADTMRVFTSTTLLQKYPWLGKLTDSDFVTSTANTLFDEFCGAVRYLCGNLDMRLPVCGDSLGSFVQYLENSAQAGFANQLRRGIGMYRFSRSYIILQRQLSAGRPKLSTRASRAAKRGKVTTEAMNQLIQSNQWTEDKKSRIKLSNTLSHSHVWAALGENFTPGILCLIPWIPVSGFERMRVPMVKCLVTLLENECSISTKDLAVTLSPHIEAILEGKACLLASWINKGALKGWSDVTLRRTELQNCTHDFEHSTQPS